MSFGRVERQFPDKSRISNVSKRSRISRGNSVRPLEILMRLKPLYWPDLSPSSECWWAILRRMINSSYCVSVSETLEISRTYSQELKV
jgi:hypothetical protein